MNTATHSTVPELIDEIAVGTERVRGIVASGDLAELEAALHARGECIQQLCRAISDTPIEETDEILSLSLAELREADRELTEWMLGQKEEVALALTSLRQQKRDPYADEAFVGSVLLNETI
jgi:hypothetical protein